MINRRTCYSIDNHLWALLAVLTLMALASGCASREPSGAGQAGAASTPIGDEAPRPASSDIILATTTSIQDSGLLSVLIPVFQEQSGYRVKTIAVGSGQAMTMGERGEADVLLVHSPDSERQFMEAGHGVERRSVMHNHFVIIGPRDDPAGIRGASTAEEALMAIARAKALFVTRGDSSGTHQLEMKLWQAAEVDPRGERWYLSTGQGMAATLNIAAEKDGYTIADRSTYLAQRRHLANVDVLVERDNALLNTYHVIVVNPEKSDHINYEGAKAFADFILDPRTQKMIGAFGMERYGSPLFFPDAHDTEQKVVD